MEPQIRERAKTLIQAIDEILAENKRPAVVNDMDKVFLETFKKTLVEKKALVQAKYDVLSVQYEAIEKQYGKTDDLLTDIDSLITDIEEILDAE